jgi:hypothetical protein
VSTRQRLTRAALTAVAFMCGALCVASAVALSVDAALPVSETFVLAVLWASGLVGFGASIAACRVEDDSTEDPRYFGTIVRGIRDEWHHDNAA